MPDVNSDYQLFGLLKRRMEAFLERLKGSLTSHTATPTAIKQTSDCCLSFYVFRRHRTFLDVSFWVVDFADGSAEAKVGDPSKDAVPTDPKNDGDYGKRGDLRLSIIEEDHSRGRREIPLGIEPIWLEFSNAEGWEQRFRQIEALEPELIDRINIWVETGE